ncbi:MAG: hypothetical protein AAGC60_20015 [Acidobacteriota bacterium]
MRWLRTEFEIPDPKRPIPPDQRGVCGPSGHLIPFHPDPLDAQALVGRSIDELSLGVGTYGMGGAGFFGLRLQDDWLVIALWGSGDWIEIEGRVLTDCYFDDDGRQRPWLVEDEPDEITPRIVGQTISRLDLSARSLCLELGSGLEVRIEESAARRPVLRNGKPRALRTDEDLRGSVFLAPTRELWI